MSDMNRPVIQGHLFNPTEIKYLPAKATKQGGKSVMILNSKINRGLLISTPPMDTWGVADFVDEETGEGNKRFTMALKFNPAGDEKHRLFLENMVGLEKKIKQDARVNCKDWFNRKELSEEVCDEKWNAMLKYRKDKETREFDFSLPPTLQIKVPCYDNKWSSEVYDYQKDEKGQHIKLFPNEENPDITPVNLIPSGSTVVCVIQCGGLYFINGKFGITWKLHQCIVKPQTPFNIKGCLIDIEDAPTTTTQQAPPTKSVFTTAVATATAQSSTMVEDSDNEGEEKPSTAMDIAGDDEEEPAAEVAATPVVKKVIKKVIKKKV